MALGNGSRPKTVNGWLKLILAHLSPLKSPEDIQEIIKLRSKAPPHVYESVLLQGRNADFVSEGLDEGDAKTAQADISKSASKGSQSKSDGNEAVPIDGAASSSSSGSKPRKKVSITGGCTPAWAKTMVPPPKGCWIKENPVRHFRWQAGYPRAKLPRSTSSTYGNGEVINRDQACIACLYQIWEIHFEETKQTCPYDFVLE